MWLKSIPISNITSLVLISGYSEFFERGEEDISSSRLLYLIKEFP